MSTEDTVLAAIKPYLSLVPLRSLHIGRDPLTNQTRGLCYLELRSVVDSMFLFQALALNPPVIDGRRGKDTSLINLSRPNLMRSFYISFFRLETIYVFAHSFDLELCSFAKACVVH